MNIAVFCSSSNHIADHYKQSAFQLGVQIAQNGNTLIYGGATGGLMDAIAEGAKSANGKIIGVIANAIVKMKRQSNLPTELIVVETMSDRKIEMKNRSDVFIVLPGSYGTMDEMLDIIASGIVGEHKKPLVIVNNNGFYDHLLKQIEYMRTEHFMPSSESYKPIIATNFLHCNEIIHSLQAY